LDDEPGIDTDKLLSDLRISRPMLEDVDHTFTVIKMNALWKAAYAARKNDEAIGIHIAAGMVRGDFGALEYLFRHSADGLTALQHFVRFQSVFQRQAASWTIEEESTDVLLSFRFLGVSFPVHRFVVDFVFCALIRYLQESTTSSWSPSVIELQRDAPRDTAPYKNSLGILPRFGAPQNIIRIPVADLKHEFSSSDSALSDILQHSVAARVASASASEGLTPTQDIVDAVSLNLVKDGFIQPIASVAAQLGMSERTLRRRLSEAGTSYQAVQDNYRFEQAAVYLKETKLEIKEIAFLLNFSDVSAFYRAIRRWTGKRVQQYRVELLSEVNA